MMKRCVVITRFARDQPGYLDFAYRIEALSRHYEVSLVSDHPLNLLVRFMDVNNYAAYTALSGLVAMCGILASRDGKSGFTLCS